MKKALLFGSLAVVSVAAQAIDMPTISGRINNEVRYTMQSDKAGEPAEDVDSFVGVEQVINAPSYVKASGNIPMNEALNLDYAVEYGAGLGAGGVSMRQSVVTLNSDFGHLVLGHTYTPSSLISKFDPLASTSAGLGGSDYSGMIAGYSRYEADTATPSSWNFKSRVEGIGYRHTLRQDIVGYKSPKFMGLQLFVSQDRNNVSTSTTNTAQRYDMALSYDNKFGTVGVQALVNYLVRHGAAAYDETQMTGAAQVSWMGWDFSGGYTLTTFTVQGIDAEKTQIFAGVSYKMDAHKLALTYGMKDFEIKEAGDETKTEQSQLSLGYEYAFNKNVAGTITGSMLTIEDKSVSTPEKKNDATALATGLRVTF